MCVTHPRQACKYRVTQPVGWGGGVGFGAAALGAVRCRGCFVRPVAGVIRSALDRDDGRSHIPKVSFDSCLWASGGSHPRCSSWLCGALRFFRQTQLDFSFRRPGGFAAYIGSEATSLFSSCLIDFSRCVACQSAVLPALSLRSAPSPKPE